MWKSSHGTGAWQETWRGRSTIQTVAYKIRKSASYCLDILSNNILFTKLSHKHSICPEHLTQPNSSVAHSPPRRGGEQTVSSPPTEASSSLKPVCQSWSVSLRNTWRTGKPQTERSKPRFKARKAFVFFFHWPTTGQPLLCSRWGLNSQPSLADYQVLHTDQLHQ